MGDWVGGGGIAPFMEVQIRRVKFDWVVIGGLMGDWVVSEG